MNTNYLNKGDKNSQSKKPRKLSYSNVRTPKLIQIILGTEMDKPKPDCHRIQESVTAKSVLENLMAKIVDRTSIRRILVGRIKTAQKNSDGRLPQGTFDMIVTIAHYDRELAEGICEDAGVQFPKQRELALGI